MYEQIHFALWQIQTYLETEEGMEILFSNKDHFLNCPICCRKLLHAYNRNNIKGGFDWKEIKDLVKDISNQEIKELIVSSVNKKQFGILIHFDKPPTIPSFLLEKFDYSPHDLQTFMSRDVIVNGSIQFVEPQWMWEVIVQNGIPNIDYIHFYTDNNISANISNKIKHFPRKVVGFDFMIYREYKQYCYIQDNVHKEYIILVTQKPEKNIIHKTLEELVLGEFVI